MSQEILLSGLIGAVASAIIYVGFYHYTEYQKLRITLLEEFTRHYDGIFNCLTYMKVYQSRQGQSQQLLEHHAELYYAHNQYLRELQLSTNIDIKIRTLYSDQELITLHRTLVDVTNYLAETTRRTRAYSHASTESPVNGSEFVEIKNKIENIMISKIKNGEFCEISLPTFYSWFQALKGRFSHR